MFTPSQRSGLTEYILEMIEVNFKTDQIENITDQQIELIPDRLTKPNKLHI